MNEHKVILIVKLSMLFHCDGKIVNTNILDYHNDGGYYKKIKEIFKHHIVSTNNTDLNDSQQSRKINTILSLEKK